MSTDFFGADPLRDPLPDDLDFGAGVRVTIDLSEVDAIRPSGLAFAFVLALTLRNGQRDLAFIEPAKPNLRHQLRHTNFWNLLAAQGLSVESECLDHAPPVAPSLVEPALVRTDASTRDNVETSVILFDKMQVALASAGLPGRDRAASVFSELSLNAAEHSHSPNGAFVMAQAHPERHEIEIAVADVGRGIRAGLGNERYATHAAAVQAAMQELVTGRRDAGGDLVEGGYGLPIVAEEADYLAIRTGDALLEGSDGRNDRGEILLEARRVTPLAGTLVVATVSMRR